jgi:hypothetical protein
MANHIDSMHAPLKDYLEADGKFSLFTATTEIKWYDFLRNTVEKYKWKGNKIVEFLRVLRGGQFCKYWPYEIALILKRDTKFFEESIQI